jgi:predicted nucleotidyltransferase
MLTQAQILRTLRSQKPLLEARFAVQRIGLFGSYARGDATSESDIDALVEMTVPTFDHYMELKFYLEDLFQTPVDIVLADSVKPRLKPYIEAEVVYA